MGARLGPMIGILVMSLALSACSTWARRRQTTSALIGAHLDRSRIRQSNPHPVAASDCRSSARARRSRVIWLGDDLVQLSRDTGR